LERDKGGSLSVSWWVKQEVEPLEMRCKGLPLRSLLYKLFEVLVQHYIYIDDILDEFLLRPIVSFGTIDYANKLSPFWELLS
jgi:hypothetical protein